MWNIPRNLAQTPRNALAAYKTCVTRVNIFNNTITDARAIGMHAYPAATHISRCNTLTHTIVACVRNCVGVLGQITHER